MARETFKDRIKARIETEREMFAAQVSAPARQAVILGVIALILALTALVVVSSRQGVN